MKKRKTSRILTAVFAAILSLALAFTLVGCGETPSPEPENPGGQTPGGETPGGDTPGGETPGETDPKFSDNVKSFDLCDSVTRAYLEATDQDQEYRLIKMGGVDSQQKIKITIGKGTAPYTVKLADNTDMTDAQTKTVTSKSVEFGGTLYPGTSYYYEVTDKTQKVVERGTVNTVDKPVRIISAGGGRNIRDGGGWTTESGNAVQYGLLYRGAQLNGRNGGPKLNESGRNTFHDELGIKTELDLRNTSDDGGQTECAFGADCNYVKIAIGQYDSAVKNYKTQIKQIFELLADESNYPIYYHCNAGADRTGTLAFLINGLLGVSESDLTKDFELTSFGGQGRRLRSDDTGSGYGDTGVFQNDSSNYVAWGSLVKYIRDGYVKGGVTTLSGGIESYLLDIGVSQNDLNKIKVLMLGLDEIESDEGAVKATCTSGGVKVYALGSGKISVSVPASGHKFAVSGTKNKTATCENCSLSGAYYYTDVDTQTNLYPKSYLMDSNATVTDVTGNAVGSTVTFTKADVSDELKYYVVSNDTDTCILAVSVWSKIVALANNLAEVNDYLTVSGGEIKGRVLIGSDIADVGEWTAENSIGYNTNGYKFTGTIDGGGHSVGGLKTKRGAALVYNFGGVIKNLTLDGETTEPNAQLLCYATYGGVVENVRVEAVIAERALETANSALLGNIGLGGEIADLYINNVTIIETTAKTSVARRNGSSALGKMYNESDKAKIHINGLTVVGVRPIISATFNENVSVTESVFKTFIPDLKDFKFYATIEKYNAAA